MGKIVCFLKFGEEEHMKGLARGEMFFSNALNYRQIEEELFIKGQGDRLEGGSFIHAKNMTIVDYETKEIVMAGVKGNILVHYEPANLLPVYCLFACYEKDCTLDPDGHIEFHFSEEIKRSIREHFPKADSVAIIRNPQLFISNVILSIGTECVSDEVNYFNLFGIDVDDEKTNDLQYFKYLAQDTPTQKVDGGVEYTFSTKYVYRSLLCKDTFFKNEQEYRFILPKDRISSGTIYRINFQENISVMELDTFFHGGLK